MKNKITTFLLLLALLIPGFSFGYSDGTLDSGFTSGLTAGNAVVGMILQPDNKILIGGDFTSYAGTPRNRIARLNADGTLDTTFNPGDGANNTITVLALQNDGKILIGGDFTSYAGTPRNRIARLNADGTLDTTFNPGQGVNGDVTSILIQSDGKVVVGGMFSAFDGDIAKDNILRLNTDGSIDNTFQSSVRFVGGINPYNGAVRGLSLQSDGKIIITGDFNRYNDVAVSHVVRINTNGSLDAGFNFGTSANNTVFKSALQNDGKILIGGDFTSYAGTPRNRIARLNADGTLDTTFNPGQGANGIVRPILLQADNRILIGGEFTSYAGTPRNRIARLNADGTLDATFNPGQGVGIITLSLANFANSKLLISGRFTSYNGQNINAIALLGQSGVVINPNPSFTQAPTFPPDMTSQTDTGSSNTDDITSNRRPDFIALCTSGSLVKLYINGVALNQSPVNCLNGLATLTPATNLPLGSHSITFTQTLNGTESAQSPALPIVITNDDIAPVINGITVIGHNAPSTPSYTFSSSEAGNIIYGGACSSVITKANFGFNTVVFNTLSPGLYSNCTVQVVDNSGNKSNVVTIAPFTVVAAQSNLPQQTTSFVDTNPVICPQFTQYLKLNSKTNDMNEVRRWQAFLNERYGAGLVVDGKFGRLSFNAVKNFQARYADDILAPWGLTSPTGYIYKSTRAKANNIFGCPEGLVLLDNGVTIR